MRLTQKQTILNGHLISHPQTINQQYHRSLQQKIPLNEQFDNPLLTENNLIGKCSQQ